MGIIKKLDQHTANLIAAGEVIERAASVVKELVENSIDAKASMIKIKLVNSGLTEIVVTDNGIGMDAVDAKLAIVPHATSKIRDEADLFRIQTLGFRGEALASIVAVSQFNIKTSVEDGKGLMYTMRGGDLVSEAIISFPRGTEITVKNLFFNTPARLQSMGNPNVELAYVTDYVTKTALANPHISFYLSNNDREILQTYGNNELLEVILASYGAAVAREMIPIFDDNGLFKIDGYISKLGVSRSNKNYINVIVNGRTIRNQSLINAIVRGYDEYMVVGRYPIAVINITLDPGMVDVNVHPAKLEVRFSEEKVLEKLITDTVASSLKKTSLIVSLDSLSVETPLEVEEDEDDFTVYEVPLPQVEQKDDITNPYDEIEEIEVDEESDLDELDLFEEDLASQVEIEKIEKRLLNEEKEALVQESFTQQKYTFFEDEMTDSANTSRLPKMSYIGQLHGTYILAQAEEEFFIIDQHAAAERVNYERILEELKNEETIKYELLVPFTLDFTPGDALLIEESKEAIEKLGIKIEDFGGGSYRVREVPIWIRRGKEQEYVEEMISQVIQNKKKLAYEFQVHLAKSLACKKSIKGNEYHDVREIEYLLSDLAQAKNPYTCPHGRPVIVKFSKYEIEKWFKRVV